MPDDFVTMHLHESRELEATLTPASGTLTLSSATVSLYDSYGAIAGGVNGTTATGITSGASAAPMAWYLFHASALSLSVGEYRLVFQITDSNGLIYEVVLGVKVTYDYD